MTINIINGENIRNMKVMIVMTIYNMKKYCENINIMKKESSNEESNERKPRRKKAAKIANNGWKKYSINEILKRMWWKKISNKAKANRQWKHERKWKWKKMKRRRRNEEKKEGKRREEKRNDNDTMTIFNNLFCEMTIIIFNVCDRNVSYCVAASKKRKKMISMIMSLKPSKKIESQWKRNQSKALFSIRPKKVILCR